MKRVELLTDAFDAACRCMEQLTGLEVDVRQIGDLGRVARVGAPSTPYAWIVEQQAEEIDRGWRVWTSVPDVVVAVENAKQDGATVRLPPMTRSGEKRALVEFSESLVGFTDGRVDDCAPIVGPPWALAVPAVGDGFRQDGDFLRHPSGVVLQPAR